MMSGVVKSGMLQSDLAEIDAGAKVRLHGFLPTALAFDFDRVGAGTLVELVEFEVAVIVGSGLRHDGARLDEAYKRIFDAVHDAVRLRRYGAADEAFGVAPQVAIVDPGLGVEVSSDDFQA